MNGTKHFTDTFVPPLAPELFEKFSFFELYPFDGGGSFINHEIIGSVDDREYTQAVVENGALAEFGGFEETDFLKFERWRTIERSCWINRMYFIAPMAAWAKKSGDEKLARKVYDIMLRFGRTPEYAAPATQEETVELHREVLRRRDEEYNALGPEFDAAIPYQWFDFQPASRIIHMIHAMYFLRDFQLLSDEEQEELEELIFIHTRNIYWGESGGIQLRPGNHQALRGLALMLGCAFFRGERGTDQWAATAEKICDFHILNDFLPDGMLIDLSPSYHFFECWITRDILLLADREHYRLSPEARERAAKAFGICRALRQPDGFSPVISDGYPLDMEIFVRSLGKLAGTCPEELFLPDAGMAVKARPDGDFLLFDCSPLVHKLSHFHGGKQAPVLFLKGRCFLTDSGCCSYDDADFSEYFKQCFAHSSLLVDGKGDSVLQGLYTWLAAPECTLSPWQGDAVSSEMTSKAPGWEQVKWRRSLDFAPGALTVTDTVETPAEREFAFVFILHKDVEVAFDETRTRALLTNGEVKAEAVFPFPAEALPGTGFVDFRKVPLKRIVMRRRSGSAEFRTQFRVLG